MMSGKRKLELESCGATETTPGGEAMVDGLERGPQGYKVDVDVTLKSQCTV